MDKIKDFWHKLKSVKHIEIYLALMVGLVICVCYFSLTATSDGNNNENSTENYTTSEEYVDYLENKISNVLSKISGVDDVGVVITLETGFTYEYATDTETRTTNSGTTETTISVDTILLVDGQPVVVKEVYPVIKGVVVVADGSEDFSVKMNILDAIQTILEVDSEKITILS